jgi:hypothetical protein
MTNPMRSHSAVRAAKKSVKATPPQPEYLSADDTSRLLANSIEWRVRRLAAPDMLSTDETAELLKTTRVTINNWVKDRRCIAVEGPTRGRKLPRWQFAPSVLEHLPEVLAALGEDASGWMQLLYFETPSPALGARSPLQALEQGEAERVVRLAASHSTSDA